MDNRIIVTSKEELKEIIQSVMLELDEKKQKGAAEKVYYVNQVARMLGKAHSTIKKLCLNGVIRTTSDGLIPESALEEYLSSK